jgi:hypothetical protein
MDWLCLSWYFMVGTLQSTILQFCNGFLSQHASIYAGDGVSRTQRIHHWHIKQNQAARRLVHNPNDVLSPYRLYQLLRGAVHPDQVFIYCYKANCKLLECSGFQMNPARRIRKGSIGKVRIICEMKLFCLYNFFSYRILLSHSTGKQRFQTAFISGITAGESWELARLPRIPPSPIQR